MVGRVKIVVIQNLIQLIKEKISKYPSLPIEETNNSLIIKTLLNEGFDISIYFDKKEVTIFYEGWHEHFQLDDIENILSCIMFGLSDKCRIKIISRRNSDCIWTLEAFENNKWIEYDSTGLIFCCWWCKKNIRYLQNKIIKE